MSYDSTLLYIPEHLPEETVKTLYQEALHQMEVQVWTLCCNQFLKAKLSKDQLLEIEELREKIGVLAKERDRRFPKESGYVCDHPGD